MPESKIITGFWPKVALSYIGAIPFSIAIFLPIIVGGMVKDLGFSSQLSGYVVAADMAGFALASLAAYMWMAAYSWRKASVIATICFVLSNVLSMYLTDSVNMLIVRLISGFAAGTVSACVVSSIAKTDNPSRLFGFWLIAQFVYAIVGFKYLPLFSLNACFMTFAVLAVSSLVLMKIIPAYRSNAETSSIMPVESKRCYAALFYVLGVFVFYIGLNAVWAYFERVGNYYNLSAEQIGSGFSIANAVAVIGALLVVALNIKKHHKIIMYGLMALIIFSIIIILDNVTYMAFTVSASLFLFSWCALVPLMLGTIADVDQSNRYMAMGNAALSWGLACGPALGAFIQTTEGYNRVLLLGLITFVMSLILFLAAPFMLNKAKPSESAVNSIN